MDVTTALITGIVTLAAVIPVLWLTLRGVERRFGRMLADSESACREDLARERIARENDKTYFEDRRESDLERLRDIEMDVRKILSDEVVKNVKALAYVGTKLAEVVEIVDLVSEQVGLPPRVKDPSRQTTLLIAALTGVPS